MGRISNNSHRPAHLAGLFLRRQQRNGHPHARVSISDAASRHPASLRRANLLTGPQPRAGLLFVAARMKSAAQELENPGGAQGDTHEALPPEEGESTSTLP